MKKFFIIFFIFLFIPLAAVTANYDDDVWSYVFYLEHRQGIIAVESGAKYSYDPIPELYIQKDAPSTSDFYAIITSGKGVELARFGFNTPNTTVVSQGKSIMEVHAPYFANADHVTFYNKAGKRFFEVSVKLSSFCNDNNICNTNIGENGRNCPNDCHTNTIPVVEPVVTTTPEPVSAPVVAPAIAPNPSTKEGTATGGVLTTSTASTKTFFTPGVIIMLVGGLLLIILGIILLRIKKNMD